MKITNLDIKNVKALARDTALILGTFDGVHVGHLALIKAAQKSCKNSSVLLIYSEKTSFKEHQKQGMLTSISDRISIFKNHQVDEVILLNLTPEIMGLSAAEFVGKILLPLAPHSVVIGADFHFGKGRQGSGEFLKSYMDFQTIIVPIIYANDSIVSTSLIKSFLQNGELKEAKALLGYDYSLTGFVEKGYKLGSRIGYPTANVKLDDNYFLPRIGVYFVSVLVRGKVYFGMASLGYHPTINEVAQPLLEVNIFDFVEDIYAETLKITFLHFLRNEVKFSTLEDLIAQLKKDEQTCRILISKGETNNGNF